MLSELDKGKISTLLALQSVCEVHFVFLTGAVLPEHRVLLCKHNDFREQ